MSGTKKRNRRTEEQMVADLQAEIERIQKRAQVRKARRSPAVKATVDAVRHIDVGIKAAENQAHKLALQEAREPLVAVLLLECVAIPKPRARRPSAAGGRKSRAPEPVGA